MLEVWSALTFALIMTPKPLGSGILSGNSSCLSTCPDSLDAQSLLSHQQQGCWGHRQALYCGTFSNMRRLAALAQSVPLLAGQGRMTKVKPQDTY